ncbi:MAG: cysteine synthase family protein [Phormidesmis sp.]
MAMPLHSVVQSTHVQPKKIALNSCWSQSIATPKLVEVDENLFVSAFSVMKVLPAIHIIQRAIERGEITSRSTIVETSSGTFALGLAIVCNELNLPLFIASDPAIDQRLKNRLESLKARIHIVEKPALGGGYQKPRLDVVKEFLAANPNAYWTRQYDNADNPDSYRSFAEYLVETFGDDFTLVGTVGSGGSTVGTIRHLRRHNPNIQLVGVDTYNSVLFGLPDGHRLLRGLGNSIMPNNLDHTCYDEVHWVAAEQAFLATHKLHAQHSVFGGPTSGAAYMVAQYIAKRNPERTVVFIGADDGERYLNTIFSHQWLAEQGIVLDCVKPCSEPLVVDSLAQVSDATASWTSLAWQRRSLSTMRAAEQSVVSSSNVLCPR